MLIEGRCYTLSLSTHDDVAVSFVVVDGVEKRDHGPSKSRNGSIRCVVASPTLYEIFLKCLSACVTC